MMVLYQGIWNPMTWRGIHLLQAGEPGQNGDCFCELNTNNNHLLLLVGPDFIELLC